MRYSVFVAFLFSTAALGQTPTPLPIVPPETVHVQAKPMTDEAGGSFVKTFTEPSLLSGKIPRWFQSICVKTEGLPAELADAVSARVVEVAKIAGAPVQEKACAVNTRVIFDKKPQAVLDDIAAKHDDLLGPHDAAQTADLAKMRYPIQAWYGTQTRDSNGMVATDTKKEMPLCGTTDEMIFSNAGSTDFTKGPKVNIAAYQRVINDMRRDCGQRKVNGSLLRDCLTSQLSTVTVVASLDAVESQDLIAVADYLALVVLSQTKAFDTCEKMETVANLMVPRCDTDHRPTGLTPGDIAFLKALYRADTGGTLVAEQASIRNEMKKLLAAP